MFLCTYYDEYIDTLKICIHKDRVFSIYHYNKLFEDDVQICIPYDHILTFENKIIDLRDINAYVVLPNSQMNRINTDIYKLIEK